MWQEKLPLPKEMENFEKTLKTGMKASENGKNP